MALDRHTALRLLLAERAKVLAYAWSILGDPSAAEDVFQELSILVVDRCSEIENERHLMGWLRTAARYKAWKIKERQHARLVALDEDVVALLEDPWRELDETPAGEVVGALRRCLERLTPNARRLVDLKYGQGLDGAQIARQLGRGIRSVYTALSRIHRMLGVCIERSLPENTKGG